MLKLSEAEMLAIWSRHAHNGGDVISFAKEISIITWRRTLDGDQPGIPPPPGTDRPNGDVAP